MKFGAWLGSLFGGERKMSTLDLFREIYGGREALTGDPINWKTALQVSTVFGCTRVIANGIAQVPFKLFRESEDGRSRLPAKDHPLYQVLYRRANPWQTSFEYRQTLAMHLVLCGNHFAFKNVIGGRVRELLPFEPGSVEVERKTDGELTYKVSLANGEQKTFPAEAIWHVRGPSWNGWLGMEAVQLARESIGLAMATERQHAKLHKNGVSTSGLYSVEGTLTEGQYASIRAHLAKSIADNSGSAMILDRGAKWLNKSMSGVDSEHLGTRRLQIEEVCRAMGVMPIMVGHSDKAATYANLLTERDVKDGLYAKFVEEGLLRGSIEATANVLDKYVNGGLMTPNEARSKLDMNPDADPESDKLRVPANIVGKQPEDTPADVAKALRLDDMERKVGDLGRQKAPDINITLNQEPVAVNVSPAEVSVKAGDVNVQAAPQAAPNVQIDVHVPQQAAPQVLNTVNVPQQPAPNVTLEATLPPLDISVSLPPRKSESQTDITRDASGNIVKSQTKTKESDA